MSSAKPNRLDAKLLADLHRFFAAQTAKHIPTERLLTWLAGIDNAPWATLADGKPITARHLARLLRPYGIEPKNIRVSATSTPKGYKVADFDTAFAQLNGVAANVAANVADKKAMNNNDVAANEMARSDVAANVAANLNNLVNVADRNRDVADRKDVVADYVVDNVDVADRNRDVADDVADNVVTITRAAVTTTDHLAEPAPAPAKPTRKWPPPKGWAWNYQTQCYEPSKPQPDPPDPETIRRTLRIAPNLKYRPGYGLVEVEPELSA